MARRPIPGRQHWLWEVLIFADMMAVECTNVGLSTIYKAAVNMGLNYHVYMAYSYAIAAAVLLPLACLIHRKTPLPPFSAVPLGKFFILGFLGFTGQLLLYLGIAYSNPTLNSAMSNLTPACTFFLAILFRLEKLNPRSISHQVAKIIGASVSIAGALVVVLYNGPMLISGTGGIRDSRVSALSMVVDRVLMLGTQNNWILGGALLAAGYGVASIWYIFQSIFVKEYPAEFILVFFHSFLPVGFVFEPHLSSWAIPPDVRLLSVFYSGIIGTGFGIMVHTWGLHVKGPVYVALFRPFSIAIAAITGVIFLGDDLYLGCVIGSIIITVGFYTLMWGKLKEEMKESPPSDHDPDNIVESSSGRDEIAAPLIKP